MNENHIEATLHELKRSSKASLVMVILGAICLLGALYYSATRLTPLERKINQLNTVLQQKQSKLDELENRLKITAASVYLLEEGTRFLLNRQYEEAIKSLNEYLALFPDSSEALGILGYAELRYTQYLRQQNQGRNTPDPDKQRYLEDEKKYVALSENHLTKAINNQRKQSHPWPAYNLTLLYMHTGNKKAALSTLSNMLTSDPSMVKWLCDDYQFRQMKIDQDIAEAFTELVDNAARSKGLSACWVTKPVIKGR